MLIVYECTRMPEMNDKEKTFSLLGNQQIHVSSIDATFQKLFCTSEILSVLLGIN